MRVTTNLMYNRSTNYLQRSNSNIDKYSQQYNTGQKFTTAAEDPTGMGNKIRLEAEIATYSQYSVNAGLASDALNLEETALSSIYDALSKSVIEMQSAVNGTMDSYNFEAIATSLEESLNLLFDLTNTKTADGEYIFSGAQSLKETMVRNSDGSFSCQADAGFRQVKVAPSVKITTSDSGLTLFEQSQVCRTASSVGDSTISYDDYDVFNNYVNSYYVDGLDNSFSVNVATDGSFELVSNRDGTVLENGTITEDNTKIKFHGMEINMTGDFTAGPLSTVVTLDAPANDNFLNSLSTVINALRDNTVSQAEKMQILERGQVNINNAKENINNALGHVGGRLSNIEQVIDSNDSLNVIKQETKANISEIDVYEAVENLLKEQNALNVAKQTFTLVNGQSLFDFI
jgi:flagellar hook-associated protein 3 FlgL